MKESAVENAGAVESVESQNHASPAFHEPLGNLANRGRDSHIHTATATKADGKVENQKQVFHFSTASIPLSPNRKPSLRGFAPRGQDPTKGDASASAISDDRGVYRIHGLPPGTYYVRTAAKQLEDGSGLLPTFHRESTALDQSLTVDVDLDQQAEDADIRPQPGKLFRLSGRVLVRAPTTVTVTLISDVGRASTTTHGKFSFEPLAPGEYQLIAEAEDPRNRAKLGAYREMQLDRNTDLMLDLSPSSPVEFRMEDENGKLIDASAAKITARRKDLDDGGQSVVLKLEAGRTTIGPGRWDFGVSPPAGYYVVASPVPDSQGGLIKLSSRPAALHGVVNGPGHEPAAGAPVYLEVFDAEAGKRLADLRVTRTDVHGQYRFRDLAPGIYRILSTFEFDNPDEETMGAAGARSVTLSEATDSELALGLYVRN